MKTDINLNFCIPFSTRWWVLHWIPLHQFGIWCSLSTVYYHGELSCRQRICPVYFLAPEGFHPPDSHSDKAVTSCQQVIRILDFQGYLLSEVNKRKKILEEYETSVLQYCLSNETDETSDESGSDVSFPLCSDSEVDKRYRTNKKNIQKTAIPSGINLFI